MIQNINGSNTFKPSQIDLELLEAILEPEDSVYPWNPADEDSDEYFLQLEQQFQMEEVLNEELTSRSQAFYNQIDTLWSGVFNTNDYKLNTKTTVLSNLQQTLQQRFANRLPQDWMSAIAQKATEIFNSQQALGEQLIQCVQSVLPSWESDDLSVMARPYAFAMRSEKSQNPTTVVENLGEHEWASLSEIEKARMSMAVAYYALNELQSSSEEA
ncbi:MAG: hypothetical protein SAK29_14860 [Scytonema sp. PMC 1069.18]|nr:hypothetical protein [Scytonema sp. PMC 1069.18]MEC4885881.1 hypothetical protein [Scytonema sp. PMC 1070.18]